MASRIAIVRQLAINGGIGVAVLWYPTPAIWSIVVLALLVPLTHHITSPNNREMNNPHNRPAEITPSSIVTITVIIISSVHPMPPPAQHPHNTVTAGRKWE